MNGFFNGNSDAIDKLLNSLMNIHEITAYSSVNSLHTLCETLLTGACEMFGAPSGSAMIYDQTTNELKMVASRGITSFLDQQAKFRPGQGVAGLAFESGEIMSVNSDDGAVAGHIAPAPVSGVPIISVPIKTRQKIYGVLNLSLINGDLLELPITRKMLSMLTAKAAMVIESLDMADTLNNRNMEMVEMLARALDAKDKYTHDHAGRARLKAEKIARAISLPEKTIVQIKYAALLHDIGKLGIREDILLKPGKLTNEEYEEIKKHPFIGYQILLPVDFLSDVARMVLYHQEWFDGSGYPHGLAGKNIPLGSRIIAIIDTWDAMISDRPYRKALHYETAINEIKKGAGTQFDPEITDVFTRLEKDSFKPRAEEAL